VVVDIDPSMSELATPGVAVRLEKSAESKLDSKITAARSNGKRMVWGLAQIDDRTAAEAWAGAAVLIEKAALPETGEDEYFDFELLGISVFDTAGTPLGVVREVVATGANDVLVAHGQRGEILIPATRVAIREVDRTGRRIIVDSRALVYEDGREGS
jgi:16S rRNA processing protein RimM